MTRHITSNLILLALGLYFLLIKLDSAESLPKFIRGKYFSRPKPNLLSAIPDQYYDQRLDHFNEALIKTWKQVNLINKQIAEKKVNSFDLI